MKQYNPENERIKARYFEFLEHAKQLTQSTLDANRIAILRFEKFTFFKSFKSFDHKQAEEFTQHLLTVSLTRSGGILTKASILNTITALKRFFGWAKSQPGYASKIRVDHIEYFNLSLKDTRAAKAPKHKNFHTLDQIGTVLSAMPHQSEAEQRDRAILAFIALTGIRGGAMLSLKLKHIDLKNEYVNQDPTEVNTKTSKRIDTYFFPVGDQIKNIVINWVKYLKERKLYGLNDPLFPRSTIGHDKYGAFVNLGIQPFHWRKADHIRNMFKGAFEKVGLDYYGLHRIRDTLVHFGQEICSSPEEFKAWSQNIGHSSTLITFTSYGKIDPHRQGDIIKNLSLEKEEKSDMAKILALLEKEKNK